MSSYSFIYIEYKEDQDNSWNLLKLYIPINNRLFEKDVPLEERDFDVERFGDKEFRVVTNFEKSGIVRDFLNASDKPYVNRGFPDNLSSELKQILDNQQKEIDRLNDLDTRENKINHDWRYGKSWCYLNELYEAIEKSYKITEKYYIQDRFSLELSEINQKLKEIHKIVLAKNKKDDNEINENLCKCCDYRSSFEELDDITYASGFCNLILDLVNHVTGSLMSTNYIRLVYYTE